VFAEAECEDRVPSQSTPQLMGVFVWGLLLLGALAMLGVALWLGRRWARSGSGEGESGAVWSLHNLRELRSSGQLSDAEFEKLRAGVLQSTGSAAERKGGATGAATGRPAQSSPQAGNDIKTPARGGR